MDPVPLRTPVRQRLAVAVLCGIWGGALAYAFLARPGFYGDFLAFWYAARAWLGGLDPYLVTPSAPPYNVDDRFFYPFPALLVVAPFARLPLAAAGAAFFGCSSGLLGFALTRDG